MVRPVLLLPLMTTVIGVVLVELIFKVPIDVLLPVSVVSTLVATVVVVLFIAKVVVGLVTVHSGEVFAFTS